MPGKRIIGIVLALAGAALLWQGWQAYQSMGSQFSRALTGSSSNQSLWLLGLGAVLAVVGVLLAARG